MIALMRPDAIVPTGFAPSLPEAAAIPMRVAGPHTSPHITLMAGSTGVLYRRRPVPGDRAARARRLPGEAGLAHQPRGAPA